MRNPFSVPIVVALVTALAFAAILVPAPAARANHDTEPWSSTIPVTGTGTVNNYSAGTIDDGHGHVYVFYINAAPAGNNIYVTKYTEVSPSSAFFPVGGFPVLVNSASMNVVAYSLGYPHSMVSAAIDASGNLYVAWTRVATGPSGTDVLVSRSTDGGLTWGLTSQVSATTAGEQDSAPAIAVAPDGTLYVVWSQTFGGRDSVAFASSSSQANTWATQKNVSEVAPSTGYGEGAPAIAVDAHGNIYVAYARYVNAFNRYVANLTRSTNGGATWTTPVTMDPGTTANGYSPQLLVDHTGRVHMAWFDNRVGPSGNPRIYYVQSSDGFATWTPPVPISQGLTFVGSSDAFHFATEGDTILIVADSSSSVQTVVISADNGLTWYNEQSITYPYVPVSSALSVDANGTFYSAFTMTPVNSRVYVAYWHSPPSKPVITAVTPGTGNLTLTWAASSESDVIEYRVWRSSDGSTYQVVALVTAPSTSFVDSGLINGTYWYKVEALDQWGYLSHASMSGSGVVGVTVEQLNAEIAALQAQLSQLSTATSTQIAALQGQITALKDQLTSLQNSQAASAAQIALLQQNITALQNQINTLQGQQATQTMSYANLAFEVIVVVLLVVLLLNQMRKPKSPTLMMAQPGQVTPPPKSPEDEL